MPPPPTSSPSKPRKETAAPLPPEDWTQDVVLAVRVPQLCLRVGLAAVPGIAPEPLQDAASVPALQLELHHSAAAAPAAPAAATSVLTLGPDFVATASASSGSAMEAFVRICRKGPDALDTVINTSLQLRLCLVTGSRAVLASATLDLLPMGLGAGVVDDAALPLQAAAASTEPFKVLPGSCAAVTVALMHQPRPPAHATQGPAAPAASARAPGTGGAHASSAAAEAADAAAAAAATVSALEPYTLVPAHEATGCNVLQFTALQAAPLPANWASAAAAAGGALSAALQLHLPLPGSSIGQPAARAVRCMGASLSSGSAGPALVWPARERGGSCRVHLPAAVNAGLRAHMELGRPLLLEVARFLGGSPGAEALADHAHASYHAVLQLECAAEQLQEPGALVACGAAVPLGCMSWALQQGKLAAPGLPPYTPPPGPRPKSIEEAPPAAAAAATAAAPLEPAPPVCPWVAAGTRFAVELRLARPLAEPWQPPPRPALQLRDLVPPRPVPPPPPAPTASERFRAQVQVLAKELVAELAAPDRCGDGSSSNDGDGQAGDSAAPQPAGPEQLHQRLVLELNSSGRYLALKQRLKPLLLEVVQERYQACAVEPGSSGINGTPSLAELHHELYSHLVAEMRGALAQLSRPSSDDPDRGASGGAGMQAATARLRQLADECEMMGDVARAAGLHERRLGLASSADAWVNYGCFCLRVGSAAKAQAALREALALDQQHADARLMLACLGAALVLGCDVPDGADATAVPWAEALAHSLKDEDDGAAAGSGGALPWALLSLLYRSQGKAQEPAARSCHQEVVRRAKAAAASLAAAATPAAAAAAPSPADTSQGDQQQQQHEGGDDNNDPSPPGDAPAAAAATAWLPDLNGYLAAAEAVLRLRLPQLVGQLLGLAAGIKDPSGRVARRLQAAHIAAAASAGEGDGARALELLQELAGQLQASAADDEEQAVVQAMLGDAHFEAGALALAKQHFRRAMQRCPAACSTRACLRLAECFMASGDAAIAADVLTTCIAAAGSPGTASSAASSSWMDVVVAPAAGAGVCGRCASTWLALARAYRRLADDQSAELALSESALCDPEHPGVWGELASLALEQQAEAVAGQALAQARRFGLADPQLLQRLGLQFARLGRFGSAAGLLAHSAALQDGVQTRCHLAAVLLSQRNFEGCQQQLAAAARLPATPADRQLLEQVVGRLAVAWPML